MKKILCLLCLLPTTLYATTCSNFNGNFTGCYSFGGCSYSVFGDVCQKCQAGSYIPSNYSCTNEEDGCDCLSCDFFNYPDNAEPDTDNQQEGQSTCPWVCRMYYYKNGNSCTHCPTNSSSELGATSINDCKCLTGYYMGGPYDDTCYRCSDSPNLSCTGSGLTYNSPLSSVSGFSCSNGQLHRDNINHTVSCQTCTDANATLSVGTCYCNTGYYGTPDGMNTTCAKCPSGTTTTGNNNQNINSCKMTAATKFCDGNGNNCMNLLDFGTTTVSGNNNIVNR